MTTKVARKPVGRAKKPAEKLAKKAAKRVAKGVAKRVARQAVKKRATSGPARRASKRIDPADKAERIAGLLDQLIPDVPIPLDHIDPYTLLVAVMLSAQTTDKKVNEVTPGLFALADTPDKMAALPVETILEAIRTVGLAPTKAKNLKGLSADIVRLHGGEVPRDEASLEALPGVGHKTASVVRAQAFGIPAFPVDTHIHRLAARWGLSSGKNVVETERDLKRIFPESTWNKLHLQIIYFGRRYCPARGHDPDACPICSWV